MMIVAGSLQSGPRHGSLLDSPPLAWSYLTSRSGAGGSATIDTTYILFLMRLDPIDYRLPGLPLQGLPHVEGTASPWLVLRGGYLYAWFETERGLAFTRYSTQRTSRTFSARLILPSDTSGTQVWSTGVDSYEQTYRESTEVIGDLEIPVVHTVWLHAPRASLLGVRTWARDIGLLHERLWTRDGLGKVVHEWIGAVPREDPSGVSSLTLRNLRFSEEVAKALKELVGVRRLDASPAFTVGEQYPVIDLALSFPMLEVLDIAGAQITDGDLLRLATLKDLKSLDVTGASVTQAAVDSLMAALPHLELRY